MGDYVFNWNSDLGKKIKGFGLWKEEEISDEEDDFKNNPVSVVCENNRVILFFDVDCFEVQLWMKELRPDLIGKDVPVVVINADQIILSVNYTAKSLGVVRGKGKGCQALTDAHLLCEKAGTKLVELVVPERYGKANTFRPLVEANRILNAVFSYPPFNEKLSFKMERNCKDELYIDVTELVDEKFALFKKKSISGNSMCIPSQAEINSLLQRKDHPSGMYNGRAATVMEGRKGKITGQELSYRIQKVYPIQIEAYHTDELRLVHGAIMAVSITQCISRETGYEVSAGVAHSKLLAKLACSLNKPKGISIITDISLSRLSKSIAFQDLPGFGGKTGDAIQDLFVRRGHTVKCVYDVLRATNGNVLDFLQQIDIPDAETKAKDLYNKCQFKDESQVTMVVHPNTISTVLSFKGCRKLDEFEKGVMNISEDMTSRINYCKKKLKRIAKELVVKVEIINTPGILPRPRDFSVPLPLPEKTNQFVSHGSIYQFIFDYIENNGLSWDKILKVRLIAQNIVDVDE